MKRKRSLAALTRDLDKQFSLFIRQRYADEWGNVSCVTCGQRKHWKEMNAGHFIPRQYRATRYLETNVAPQCVHCNQWRRGNLIEYYAWMQKTHGQETIDELRRLKGTTRKFTRADLEELLERYQ